ncbi:MAG: 3-deoxy-7-phosphoheptulonate synthase, partial [Clostridia bacterium]|nr:3-deoxy-7-phosphoheptulonate synthase [Clostridia bacterium]
MILVIKNSATTVQIDTLRESLSARGLILQEIQGETTRMIGLAGDTSGLSADDVARHSAVERVMKVQEPYKLAGRKFHPEDTVITVRGSAIGGGRFDVIAGPCSVESEEQITEIAIAVKKAGAGFLRGGAFKPRSSPYAFQGLGLDGLELLKHAQEQTGLPIVTEILSPEYLKDFERDVDVIQIGARNMQNFQLLREVGRLGKPVLLKRGLSSTIEELLMAAEYVMAGG